MKVFLSNYHLFLQTVNIFESIWNNYHAQWSNKYEKTYSPIIMTWLPLLICFSYLLVKNQLTTYIINYSSLKLQKIYAFLWIIINRSRKQYIFKLFKAYLILMFSDINQ